MTTENIKILRIEGEGEGVRREINRATATPDDEMAGLSGTYRAGANREPGQLGVTYYNTLNVVGDDESESDPGERPLTGAYIDLELRGDSWEQIRESLRAVLAAIPEPETPLDEPAGA